MPTIDCLIDRISNGSIEPNVVAPCISLDDFDCSTSKEDVLFLLKSARNGTLHPVHTGTVVSMLLRQHAYNQPLELTVLATDKGMQILPKRLGLVLPLEEIKKELSALTTGEYCMTCDEQLTDCNCHEHENCLSCGEPLVYVEYAECHNSNCSTIYAPTTLPDSLLSELHELHELPNPTCDGCGSRRECKCELGQPLPCHD